MGFGGGVIDGLSLQFDKEENLLNGQHRLRAIIESGVSFSRSQKYSEEFYKKIHEFMKGRI